MKKIIIVEDEEILRNLLRKKLEIEGYEVETAEDGEVGIRKIRETKFDLILLDIIMPKMGGFDVLEVMQKDENISDIPVIVISNSGQPVEIDRAQKLGVKDWVVKTEFDPQEVIKKVKEQIGLDEGSEQ
ncbi:MAG: response regulator [Patescibacteria group bacterium]|nr:response regulator [Patescibacteria group bacterium]